MHRPAIALRQRVQQHGEQNDVANGGKAHDDRGVRVVGVGFVEIAERPCR